MHSSIQRFKILGLFVLMGSLLLSACATKKFVREQVATLEPKIAAVSASVKENAERIDAVDREAKQGIAAAATADGKAVTAQAAAATADGKAVTAQTAAATAQTAANAAAASATTANQAAATVNQRVTTVDTRIGTVDNYTQSGQVQSVMFANDKWSLSDDAKKALDGIAGPVKGLKAGYLLEVQGFTDATGDEGYNLTLSQRRADAVLRYLVTQGVMLSRISILGQGEEKPVGDNKNKDGRAQNRRVEVRVLRSPIAN